MSMHTLQARAQFLGGNQYERMKKQKEQSLRWALKNDHNARMIQTSLGAFRALIIDDTSIGMNSDYDKKFISVPFDCGLKQGDTFRIIDDDTHWMVYLPKETNISYLRAQIIDCHYTIDIDGETYWIYLQGPTETDIRWNLKRNTTFNEPNLSGTIYITKNEHTLDFFHRFTKVNLGGHTWEIQVVDDITVPNILELEIQEYFTDSIADLPKIVNAKDNDSFIHGPTLVGQDVVVGFGITPERYSHNLKWQVYGNPRVMLEGVYDGGRSCKVKIYPGAIKNFHVKYGENDLRVEVDWHKPVIQGPQEVYPYDTHTYWLKGIDDDTEIQFKLGCDDNVAKFVEIGNDYAKVKIMTGKKDNFVLYARNDDDIYELPIQVKSL